MEKIICGCATDKGRYRKKNQDRILCWNGSGGKSNLLLACVCDGVGSFEYSEFAAEIVTEGLGLWIDSVVDQRLQHLSEAELVEDLLFTIYELNELVYEKKVAENIRLGCTMSVLLIISSNYYVFHVGDSRIYKLNQSIKQLTVDEVVISQIDGKIRLANCIGKDKTIHICQEKGVLYSGDSYVVGSDGLFKKLKLEEIQDIIGNICSRQQMQKLCSELICKVEKRGEKDNISCIIVKII